MVLHKFFMVLEVKKKLFKEIKIYNCVQIYGSNWKLPITVFYVLVEKKIVLPKGKKALSGDFYFFFSFVLHRFLFKPRTYVPESIIETVVTFLNLLPSNES